METLCYFDNEHDGVGNISYFFVPHTLQECYLASQTYKMRIWPLQLCQSLK